MISKLGFAAAGILLILSLQGCESAAERARLQKAPVKEIDSTQPPSAIFGQGSSGGMAAPLSSGQGQTAAQGQRTSGDGHDHDHDHDHEGHDHGPAKAEEHGPGDGHNHEAPPAASGTSQSPEEAGSASSATSQDARPSQATPVKVETHGKRNEPEVAPFAHPPMDPEAGSASSRVEAFPCSCPSTCGCGHCSGSDMPCGCKE